MVIEVFKSFVEAWRARFYWYKTECEFWWTNDFS